MTGIALGVAKESLESILNLRPELMARFRDFYLSFWRSGLVPHRVLALTRLRIAAIHDCDAEWTRSDPGVAITPEERAALRAGDFSGFSPDEQQALCVAEQLPYNHHGITDGQVESLHEHYGAAGAVSLLTAMSFFDVNCRMKICLGVAPDGSSSDAGL